MPSHDSGPRCLRAAALLLCLGTIPGAPLPGADKLELRLLTPEGGLSEASAETVLQDHRGFIWIGTNDGLNRFDGYRFKVYRHDPEDPSSLRDNVVHALAEDGEGMLWVGTERGLDRYDPVRDEFEHFEVDASDPRTLSDPTIQALLKDRRGTVWIGTYFGLNRFDRAGQRFHRYLHDPQDMRSLPANSVLVLAEERDGGLWVGTEGGGFAHLDPKSGVFTRRAEEPLTSNGPGARVVRGLLQDRHGELWIGTDGGGLFRLDPTGGSLRHYSHDAADPRSIGSDAIRPIYEDSRGTLWIGTDGGGLNRFDRGTGGFVRYAHERGNPASLGSNVVRSLMEDREGNLWIGCFAGGLSFLDRHESGIRRYQSRPDGSGLSHNSVLSFMEDADGTLWVGTEGGLDRLSPGAEDFAHYRHDPDVPGSLSANAVLAIERDRRGRLWVGTFFGGLNRMDEPGKGFRVFQHDPSDGQSLGSPHVWDVLEDSRGTVWVATSRGLDRFVEETGSFVHYRHDPDEPTSLSHDVVWVLDEDARGRLWVGTLDGLDRFDPERDGFVHFDDLSHSDVLAIHPTLDGRVWVGTRGGGLNLLDPEAGACSVFDTKDGLPNDVVVGILEDSEGRLWLATGGGLSRFDPVTRSFKNYDSGSGLGGHQFNISACLRRRSGELLFGGLHGFNAFYPGEVRDNPHVPPVVITDLQVFGRSLDVDPEGPLTEEIAEASQITLSADESVFTLEFAALDYRNPRKNRYAYMLEGFDRGWVEAGDRRTATYTNLDPGSYVFRVRGSNDSGVWNEEGTSLRIHVTPPFWGTWWFRLLSLGAFAGLLLAGHRLRTRYIVNRNRALQLEVDQRRRVEQDLAAANLALEAKNAQLEAKNTELERFAHTVSHDLKSPLVTISGFLGGLEDEARAADWERLDEDIGRIRSAAETMTRLLDDILQLSRAGRLASPDDVVDLGALVRSALALLAGRIEGRGIEVQVREDLPSVRGDRVRLQAVFQNLIENALKFMGETEGPRIEIGARRRGGELLCHVRDNGRGIDPSYHEHVFGLFNRLDPGVEGTGLGLALVRRIVEAHGGRVWVESKGSGQGSTFYFTLPDPQPADA